MAMLKRQSNIELLRIVAMFLVLVMHADFMILGRPTLEEMHAEPLSSVTRIFIESLSVVCVNVFVLISGWFGIHPNVKGVCKFLFQCFFFLLELYALSNWASGEEQMLSLDYLFMQNSYWFVKAYIGLLLMAPLMNAFITKTSKKQLSFFILCFYAFQTLYGWIVFSADFIMNGFSTFSFMGLYMLGRYVRLYSTRYTELNSAKCLGVYFSINIFLTIVTTLLIAFDREAYYVPKILVSYVNPFTVLTSLYLLLGFVKMQFNSRLINWIAASSFAVYLLHCNIFFYEKYFKEPIISLYTTYNGFVCLLMIFVFLLFVFVLSVIMDQMRILCWTFFENKVIPYMVNAKQMQH